MADSALRRAFATPPPSSRLGVMMAVVMGVDPADKDTLDRANDLGLAFQLSNIARDIVEDDAAGRCYLPVEWLVPPAPG